MTDRMMCPTNPFDHQPRTRIVFGIDAVDRVGELASELGARRVLLVTDAGISDAGHAQRAREKLQGAQLAVAVFDGVQQNPTTRDVDACLEVAKNAKIDLIVGLGGGSSLDTAKGCNFLLTNGGAMADYLGTGKTTKPMLPLIAIPTTAGTGSEFQSFAVIADANTRQKMACGDPKALAAVAILDPRLTLTQPLSVTACTGIDAVTHAVETFVTKRRSALSMIYSREAFRQTATHLAGVLDDEADLEARAAMLLGAALGGMAIENSMLGAAHSAANPLTAHFDVVHGQAVGTMLPHVIRFNADQAETRREYAELARDARLIETDADEDAAVQSLIDQIEHLLNHTRLPYNLKAFGVDRTDLDSLAAEAAQQWTARFNPRVITRDDFMRLYEAAYTPAV